MPVMSTFSGAASRAYGQRGKKPKSVFAGGNQSVSSLRTLMETLTNDSLAASPTAGGTLTVNSVALGSYDYVIKEGNQTVSSFSSGDWFTGTENTRSALIAIDGNLTINAGQTFTPSVRKLFTSIYVRGNLEINGVLSMSNKGANHSATAEGVVLLQVGTSVGSTGASGGNGGPGNTGSGNGAAGTIFTGGSAGGGASAGNAPPYNAATRGGTGGAGGGGGGFNTGGGGAGNPGGPGANAPAGGTGTGGTLFIYCTGTVSGSGSITSNAAVGGGGGNGDHRRSSGGGAGGGHVTIMRGSGNVSISTTGGAAGARNNPPNPEGTSGPGNAGGTGTNQVIAL
jgi:hypothetical protein